MAGTNENSGAVKPANFRETTNRRALKDIQNNVGAPSYHCAVNKRQLKDVNCGNDNNVVPRRPITRQFASTLASKSQQSNQETSDKHDQISEKYDVDVPMAEESEEMEECELNEEIEMEDLVVESALNINTYDKGNPLEVADYVDDIYNYYKRVEATSCVNPSYMSNQFDINDKMRAILIDWLIEVHYKFELMEETLYLTVNLIDRFLSRQAVVRKKLQLVGVTAMLLACKYEEVSVPVVDDLVTISDRAYTREEVLDMEKLMAKILQFNMSVPTPYVFLRRFLKTTEPDRKFEMRSFVEAVDSDKKMELLSSFIIELSLVEYEMLKFPPSLLAAAAVYTAHCSLERSKCWTKASEQYTMYTEDQLLECSKMMVQFHRNAGKGKLTGAHRKYSTLKFGFVSKSDPALFLLDLC